MRGKSSAPTSHLPRGSPLRCRALLHWMLWLITGFTFQGVVLPTSQHAVTLCCQIEQALQEFNRRDRTPLVRRMPTQDLLERPLQPKLLQLPPQILVIW